MTLENEILNEPKKPQFIIGAVISSKKFELTYEELYNLIKEGYRNGYAAYEIVDAGLESYDADGYTRWALLGLQ